ncbi:hypothetical protein WN943_013148 [Citrus x changshan-huyou]
MGNLFASKEKPVKFDGWICLDKEKFRSKQVAQEQPSNGGVSQLSTVGVRLRASRGAGNEARRE